MTYALAAALAMLGCALGSWGLRWGLPDSRRIERVLPPGMDPAALHRQLADSWTAMHKKLGDNLMLSPEAFKPFSGVERIKPGWTWPPPVLMNSVRSFHLRSGHDDEQTWLIILSRMKPWKGDLRTHMFTYGGAHIYSMGAALAVGAVLGLVELKSSVLPYLADPPKMAAMYMAGRVLSVAMYVACGLMLLRIGRRRLGQGPRGVRVGALAALFFLLSPAAIVQAHVLKNHMFWSFFALWTLDLSLGLLETGGALRYAAAGAAAGLALGSFLVAWPACLVVAAAACVRLAAGRGSWKDEAAGLTAAAAAALAAFLATNPYWVLDFREAVAEMSVLGGSAGGVSAAKAIQFLLFTMPPSVTEPALALTLAGCCWAAWKNRKEPAWLLCLLAFALGLSVASTLSMVSTVRLVRYFLAWTAVGQLLAAKAAWELFDRGVWGRRLGGAVIAAATLQLAAAGLTYAYNFHAASTPRSTHYLAGDWIEANLPPEAVVGMLATPAPSNAPYFRYDRYELMIIEAPLFKDLMPPELPRFLVVALPDFDLRPSLGTNFTRYERMVRFERPTLLPWMRVHPSAMTANPVFEVYRLRAR
ncbi:MAG: hypothetical protein HY748_14170 [Elusimicrobia bacterium]|nr:hypothetical protein [Elusimicrobiota bacterium]